MNLKSEVEDLKRPESRVSGFACMNLLNWLLFYYSGISKLIWKETIEPSGCLKYYSLQKP